MCILKNTHEIRKKLSVDNFIPELISIVLYAFAVVGYFLNGGIVLKGAVPNFLCLVIESTVSTRVGEDHIDNLRASNIG